MSGNSDFLMVSETGWRHGLNNLLDNEFAGWWKTKMWWIQSLIWVSVTGFMLAGVMFSSPDFDIKEGMMLYSIFAGLFPAVGVVIIMQDALVGEKTTGTLAWILSKPVARPAIILSKTAANSLGILVTMVVIPGIFAYVLFSYAAKSAMNPLPFLAAFGVIFLSHLFYLTLTLMLGAFFNGRGPVIGIALGLLFLQQYLVALLPVLRYVLPWTLVIPINNTNEAIVPALLSGQPVYSFLPILFVAVECLFFVLICVWRFNRDEF
jgi:ABC-type transport system involved in multi-copper enzyme maturation permease subunit